MPRTEARIFCSIWDDEHFLELDSDAQRLYMFLVSQKDLTYCGVMPLRPPRWAKKAAQLTVATIEAALKELEASPREFVVTDTETGELFVRALIRRDRIWMQPNLLKLAREAAGQIDSERIRSALLAELRRLPLAESGSEQVKTLVAEFIQDLEHPTLYPTPYPPPDPRDEPSRDPTAEDHARAGGNGERNGSTTSDLPVPLIPVPPSLPAQDRKRGTRLPEDFTVTPAMVTWFRENCPHVNGKTQTDKFMDHWRQASGANARKRDWVAAWRNWMRTAEERAGPRKRESPSLPMSAADQRRAEVAQLREFDRQQREGQLPNVIPGSVIE